MRRNFNLPDEVVDMIDEMAEFDGLNRSEVVALSIRDYASRRADQSPAHRLSASLHISLEASSKLSRDVGGNHDGAHAR